MHTFQPRYYILERIVHEWRRRVVYFCRRAEGKTMYTFQERFFISEHMMEGLMRWVEHAVVPGGFLRAVLANDLKEACGRADVENMTNLPAFVAFLYNECPSGCWGSPEKVKAWTKEIAEAAAAARAAVGTVKEEDVDGG